MNGVTDNGNKGPTGRRRWLPLAAIVALGVVGMGTDLANAGPPSVPFSAEVSGTVTLSADGLTFTLAGRGKSTHLGTAGYQGFGVFTSQTSDTLTETLTAANGDTLTLVCEQAVEDLGDGVLKGTDSWTVVGGTGRFAGATGEGTGVTYVHNLTTFTKHMTGRISYR